MGITADLRWTAAKLMNIGKIAVDSAVSEVYPKRKRPSGKRSTSVMMEEMQAKLEKLRRDKNNVEQQQQQQQPSEITTEEKEPQPLKNGMPEESVGRKIFIRSRL